VGKVVWQADISCIVFLEAAFGADAAPGLKVFCFFSSDKKAFLSA
jgi:hypothetical protein